MITIKKQYQQTTGLIQILNNNIQLLSMLLFSKKFCFSSVFVVYKFVLHGKQFHELKSKLAQQVVMVLASYKWAV